VQYVEDKFWGEMFPVYARWKDRIWNEYVKKGYVKTLTGFLLRSRMKYNDVTNYPIQGSGFHCLLYSLINMHKEFKNKGLKSKIIGQIHDSIVIDVYKDEVSDVIQIANYYMTQKIREDWDWLIVPLEIEVEISPIGEAWSEKQPIKLEDYI
jgi:DNA polymerase-1